MPIIPLFFCLKIFILLLNINAVSDHRNPGQLQFSNKRRLPTYTLDRSNRSSSHTNPSQNVAKPRISNGNSS
jgi:hypothetical protein